MRYSNSVTSDYYAVAQKIYIEMDPKAALYGAPPGDWLVILMSG